MRASLQITAAAIQLAVLVLVAGGEARAQGVYRCTDAAGAISLQDRPCGREQRSDRVEIGTLNVLAPDPDAMRIIARNAYDAATTSTAEMVQSLGSPTVTNTDYLADGTVRQQHVYRYRDGSRRYVYTRDGVVETVQVRPAAGRPRHGYGR